MDPAALAALSSFISSVGFPVALACAGVWILYRFLSQIGKSVVEFLGSQTTILNRGALDHVALSGKLDTQHEKLSAKIESSEAKVIGHLDSVRGDLMQTVDALGDRALRPLVDAALANTNTNSTRTPPTGTALRIEKAPRSRASVPDVDDTITSNK